MIIRGWDLDLELELTEKIQLKLMQIQWADFKIHHLIIKHIVDVMGFSFVKLSLVKSTLQANLNEQTMSNLICRTFLTSWAPKNLLKIDIAMYLVDFDMSSLSQTCVKAKILRG